MLTSRPSLLHLLMASIGLLLASADKARFAQEDYSERPGQHTASAQRRFKRARVRKIGRRQERRERCRSYALKREASNG